MDAVTTDACVVPKGSIRMDASGKTITNEVFSGVAYPDKLESFLHGMVSVQYTSLSKAEGQVQC